MIQEKSFRRAFIIILLAILVVLAFFLLKPIILSILTGIVLAYVLHPVYIQIKRVVKGKNASAFIVCIIIIIIIAIPVWFFAPVLVQQTFEIYTTTQKINIGTYLQAAFPSLFSNPELATQITVSSNSFFSKISTIFISQFSGTFNNLPYLVLQLAVIIFTFFFSLRDWEKLVAYLKSLSPFTSKGEEQIFHKFSGITKSVVYGQVLVGIVQGLAAGAGFFIFKAPHPALLTLLAVFLAIIPLVGCWPVWIVAVVYLFLSGHTINAILLLIYCAAFVSWIDNVLRAWLIKKAAKINPGVALIGMLGGLFLFGIIGMVIGPLILAYLLVILDFYKEKKFSELFRDD